MKTVILDGHAINPGDLSWDALRNLGSLKVSLENSIVPRPVAGADAFRGYTGSRVTRGRRL